MDTGYKSDKNRLKNWQKVDRKEIKCGQKGTKVDKNSKSEKK